MPAARLDDIITAAIDVVAPANGLDPAAIDRQMIEPRAGEKAYEELMTEDESRRAIDIGDMYAVLPSIEVSASVRAAYADQPAAPPGAYRSDGVEPLELVGVRALVAETFAAEGRPAPIGVEPS
jgi:FlaA1/EpsC-like NDP-sugar epimerase